MNSQQVIDRFETIVEDMKETIRRKNNDYSRGSDPFKNLRRHEEYGVVVRMDDKISRLDSFFNPKYSRTLAVTDESILDTAKDLANYAVLLVILHEDLEEKRRELTPKSAIEELRERVGYYDTAGETDPDITKTNIHIHSGVCVESVPQADGSGEPI